MIESLRKPSRILTLIMLVMATGLAIVMISDHSIWEYEAHTYYLGAQDSYSDMVSEIERPGIQGKSVVGYATYIWLWEKVFGDSEVALRMANIPLFLILLLSIWYLPMDPIQKMFLLSFYLASPFLLARLNEANNMIALLVCTALILHGLIYYFRGKDRQVRNGLIMSGSALILGGLIHTLFFAVGIPIFLIFIWYSGKSIHPRKKLFRDWVWVWGGFLFVTILMGVLFSNSIAFNPAAEKVFHKFQWLIFRVYEMLGFEGLGPDRITIEKSPHRNTFENLKLPLRGLLLTYILGGLLFFFPFRKNNKFRQPWLGVAILGLGLEYIALLLFDFEALPRWEAIVFPFMALVLSYVFRNIYYPYRKLAVAWMIALIAFWGYSSWNIRFNDAYKNYDFRRAVAELHEVQINKEEIVFWSEDPLIGAYYGLDFLHLDNPLIKPSGWVADIKAKHLFNPSEDISLSSPTWVIWFDHFNDYDVEETFSINLARNGSLLISRTEDYSIYHIKPSLSLYVKSAP